MRAPLLVLAALTAACTLDPVIPAETVPIVPPPAYRVWWEAARPCVAARPAWPHAGERQQERPFETVRWYVTAEPPRDHTGQEGAGLEVDGRIYLHAPWRDTPWVVQHELVHAIFGIEGHPAEPFQRCQLMWWQQ